ncbi:hypothetical protein [Pseudorhodobacter ferrugineus]|uniref:hypothetical protein n=1 Tax=Pseudorhodobacter ferrugineus TaxID=77008 RepID=UPI0003B54C9B|nr:hypothetical protein [Pseudorhodobacter ferrugineus]
MKRPMFLAAHSYRQRRLRDAARLLPILASFLIILPMLWGEETGDLRYTGRDAIYLFTVWLVLIVAAALLARRLSIEADTAPPVLPKDKS